MTHSLNPLSLMLLMSILLMPQGLSLAYGIEEPGSKPGEALTITSGSYVLDFTSGSHWFKIDLSPGETIEIFLTVPGNAALDLYLHSPLVDESGIQGRLASSEQWTSSGGTENIHYVAEKPGSHYIKVGGIKSSGGSATYELKVFKTNFAVVDTYWGDGTSRISVEQGDSSVPLTVIIDHKADYSIASLEASLSLTVPFSNAIDPAMSKSFYGRQVEPGETATFVFGLDIDPDALIGIHHLTMIVDYYVSSAEGLIRAIPVEMTVGIPLLGTPELIVESDLDRLVAGEPNSISLLFSNSGTATARALEVVLTPPSGVTILGSDRRINLGSIAPSETISKTIVLSVSDSLILSNINLDIALSYRDGFGFDQTTTRPLGFNVVRPENVNLDLMVDFSTLQSGFINNITLSIGNLGTRSIEDLEVKLTLPNGVTMLTSDAQTYIRTLEGGASAQIPISLYLAPSDRDSVIQVQFSLSFYDSRGTFYSQSRTIGFITLAWESPVIEVSSDISTLLPGDINTVVLTVRNLGNSPIHDLLVTFSPPSSVAFMGSGNPFHLDRLDGGDEVQISILLYVSPSIASSVVHLPSSISYRDSQSIQSSSALISLLVAPKDSVSPLTISIDSNILRGGNQDSPTITIRNSGEGQITSFEVSIEPSSQSRSALAIIPGTEKWSFDSISSDDERAITPEIIASLGSIDSLQGVTLIISYIDALGNLQEESRDIGFSIKGVITMDFQNAQASPSTISPGEAFALTGNILNKGTTVALYATITLKEDLMFQSSGGGQYIGDINPNTPIPFSISVNAERGIPDGVYPITVVLIFEDNYGDEYTEEIELQVTVSPPAPFSRQPDQNTTPPPALRIFFLGALVALVVGGIYLTARVYRSRG